MQSLQLPVVDLRASSQPAADGRTYLREVQRLLSEKRAGGRPELPIAGALSDAFDLLLREALGRVAPYAQMAVLAVGGYGRRELAPRADLDLVFWHDGDAEQVQAEIEPFLYLLWDMKIEVGYAARSADEWRALLRSRDLTALTALLDARVVVGSEATRAALEGLRREALQDLHWLRGALLAEHAARRAKYGGAGFLLEPELKFGEGGLRDLSLFRWLAHAWRGARDLDALAAADVLPLRVVEPLLWAWEHLLWLRALLHEEAGRRTDRLTFDKQEALAQRARTSVEALMRDYYRCARAISEGLRELFARAEPEPAQASAAPLGDGLFLRAGTLRAEVLARFSDDPVYVARAFAESGRHRAPLHHSCRDAIAEAVPRLAEDALLLPRAERRHLWELVVEVLVRGGEPLASLHALEVLGALLPEWRPLTALWLLDLYHVYTVDAHTLYGLQNLSRFRGGDPAFPMESALARQIDDPAPLFLGLLLHDIGKSEGAEGHSERGAAWVPRICARMALPPEQAREVAFLVGGHLLLSQCAFRRDIADPDNLRTLAAQIGTEERLRALFLLTMADVAAVGPGRLTDWKATLLRELYTRTLEVLRGGTSPALGPALPDGPLARAVFASLPPGQLRYASSEGRERLVQAAARVTQGEAAALAVLPDLARGGSEALLCAADAPGLLAKVAGVFAAAGIEILEAQIASFFFEGSTYALDRFWVRDRTGAALVEEERWERARAALVRVLLREVEVSALLADRRGPAARSRSAPGAVALETQGARLRVEVNTQDRPGLLHDLADALAAEGFSIELAKILTEAGRAVDVFYARAVSPGELSPARLRRLQEQIEAVAQVAGEAEPEREERRGA